LTSQCIDISSIDTSMKKDIEKGLLTMSSLGVKGRLGNQIFQYAFLRICAQEYDLEVQVPDWIGRHLFGHPDPLIAKELDLVREVHVSEENIFSKYTKDEILSSIYPKERLINKNLEGYFLYRTNFYATYKGYFRSLFKPIVQIEQRLKTPLTKLQSQGQTLVGLHIRLGDYGTYPYLIAPSKWYLSYLATLWETLENPVLFIASDDLDQAIKDFKEYNPITIRDLNISLPEADFYPEFYLLSQCDVLAISNSTYSFTASMLNEKCSIFARPCFKQRKLIPYDPWYSEPYLWPAEPMAHKFTTLTNRVSNTLEFNIRRCLGLRRKLGKLQLWLKNFSTPL
jgi:hypothetical protein